MWLGVAFGVGCVVGGAAAVAGIGLVGLLREGEAAEVLPAGWWEHPSNRRRLRLVGENPSNNRAKMPDRDVR